ncbi:4-(cytidine 5'-diphospho)-2-C-methyl-D-erythritol kinase [Ciceribacter ferrooxidans]|uniref:4-diphosphocytidyl-2-C-methyl-D-erythritol kinase n=1 Tax=Ciceribacter ferrooxidans TaxID=2509717 RepID=A0A4Q2S5W2_9HYPH|nr:4-(cytidine 5'-diphospho)-2-C-methyl-D-erythritol kinase [Ciceribacter ferrooxidans]RYB97066.1 4-(cytidine 5'-diphospho)-2-C-methyl-D-erythritol kinase [Ciceribacter ferrooxidans]
MSSAGARISAGIVEKAPAKINLALHVTGRREDGYHLLDSIVTFAAAGDRLTFAAASEDSLSLSGRFGPVLAADPKGTGDNLVTKARDLLREALRDHGLKTPPVAIALEKNLPIASGIGGGSADAAATLRGLIRLWNADLPASELAAIALRLGADVPMCLAAQPLRAGGIGEAITPLPAMPSFVMVLANPLKAVSTPEVFRRLERRDNPPISSPPPVADREAWIAWLSSLRNDLEAPARALVPEIGTLCDMLAESGADLVRMSGSGATCFGLYGDYAAAGAAVRHLSQQEPHWYFEATRTVAGDSP